MLFTQRSRSGNVGLEAATRSGLMFRVQKAHISVDRVRVK